MNDEIFWKYPDAIVSCEWLNKNLNNPDIRIYDCTTYLHYRDKDPSLPYIVESGKEKYDLSHIPNSSFLDLQLQLSDQDSPYRFTLPKLEILAESFSKLGVGDPFHIILYSRNGSQWSARLWWMLRAVGFDKVSILDGGFNEWERLGFITSNVNFSFPASNLTFLPRDDIFVNKDTVKDAINDNNTKILNSLTSDIHSGNNPRYGRHGRIPNSLNIPFHELLDTKSGKFKNIKELSKLFFDKNIFKNQKVLNYCGGGIAASLEAFVLYQLGFEDIMIYDNSLSEWAIDENLPIEKD
jgi:thiosulfate/3-mercaptopyruvate sulfurtransferase